MKVLIVYDSMYGNTEKIARAIGGAMTGEVKVLRATEANPAEVGSFDLLIVGSPTQGGRPLPAIRGFLDKVTKTSLKGIKVAAFDTRVSAKWVGIFGYAAGKIARGLKTKGGTLILSPEGFFVKGVKGPLKEGELERATSWTKGMLEGNK